MRAVSLFNNACREQIGEQIGREQIIVLVHTRSKMDISGSLYKIK